MPLELACTAEQAREHLKQNLRSECADDKVRDHVRILLGPQPYRHNHYAADEFFCPSLASGTLHNVYGQRLLLAPTELLRLLASALTRLAPSQADSLLYRCGYDWGAADMQRYTARVQQEYEVQFEHLGMGVMLQTWWWPHRASGWGTWRFNLEHARRGVILIDVMNSVAVNQKADRGRCTCSIYAGLFAAAFGHLSRRELAGLELTCGSQGHEFCQFLVTGTKRIHAATAWRDEGISTDVLVKKLAMLSSS